MPSFDVVSRVDLQEMDNAVNMAKKEVATRFDFRGSKTEIELVKKDALIRILTEDDMKLRALRDMLITKAVKRGIDTKVFDFSEAERAGGDMLRQEVHIANGIEIETARKVVKLIKDAKLKVQASIQGDEVRVSGKKRDDLQEVIVLLKESDIDIPLQYINMRD